MNVYPNIQIFFYPRLFMAVKTLHQDALKAYFIINHNGTSFNPCSTNFIS